MRNSILLFVLMGLAVSVSAQKFGYMNSRALLASLPEVGKADTVMGLYQKQLTAEGDSLGKKFDGEYKVFLAAKNAGTLSQIELAKRVDELKKQQALLQKFSQDAQEKMGTLRKQLLSPILARLDKAINDFAKAEKFDMIFDTGSGEALFVDQAFEVSDKVKKILLAGK